MTTENLQQTLSAAANGSSEIWDATTYSGICVSAEWSGADAITAELELQASTDKVNWNCYGASNGVVSLDAASGYQVMEVPVVVFPYWRLNFTANTNTAGTIIIRTFGKLLHRQH